MKEVKTPRKPFIFYYIVVLLILMLINMFVMPTIREASIKKVDYNEFMNMTLNKQIKKVEIDDSQITFTDQNGTVSVSYTHLDVYKRQQQNHLLQMH